MKRFFYQGHLVRKRFGQHFLHDNETIKNIVSVIRPQPNEAMVEIGPGLGALTEQILQYLDMITVIELDSDLAIRLINHPLLRYKVKVLKQDAMKVDFSRLSNEQGQNIRVFGNLPYNISIPFLLYLLKYLHGIRDMHFMLQKEVANRIIARPNTKHYGRLSVIMQCYCKISLLLEVPSIFFRPIPKVDSCMVRLVPSISLLSCPNNLNQIIQVTSLAFSKRRKMLRNSLSSLFSVQELTDQGIDCTQRAENLSVECYQQLAKTLKQRYFTF